MARRKKDGGNDAGSLTYSQVTMLFESLEKQIRIIAEQYGEIRQKLEGIDELKRDMAEVKERLTMIELRLKNKVDRAELEAVKKDLLSLQDRVTKIEAGTG